MLLSCKPAHPIASESLVQGRSATGQGASDVDSGDTNRQQLRHSATLLQPESLTDEETDVEQRQQTEEFQSTFLSGESGVAQQVPEIRGFADIAVMKASDAGLIGEGHRCRYTHHVSSTQNLIHANASSSGLDMPNTSGISIIVMQFRWMFIFIWFDHQVMSATAVEQCWPSCAARWCCGGRSARGTTTGRCTCCTSACRPPRHPR